MRFITPRLAQELAPVNNGRAGSLAYLLNGTSADSPRDMMISNGTMASTNTILSAFSDSDDDQDHAEQEHVEQDQDEQAQVQPLAFANTDIDDEEPEAAASAYEGPVLPATPIGGPQRTVRWTVKNPGTVRVPTTDNYNDWRVDQLRKECVERRLKPKRTWTKAEHIEQLQNYDEVHARVEATVDSENELPASQRQTKHCCFRLLNILFSDHFSEPFRYSDVRVTRAQLEAGTIHLNSPFWKDITHEFLHNHTDFNGLYTDPSDTRYADIDPSHIVEHDTAKLFKMWRKVNQRWVKAMHRFTQSGTHNYV